MSTVRRVAKNTAVLTLGRVLSTALGIMYVAVLARYVHAAGMGQIATATSLVSVTILIVNFGLGELIVRDIASDRAKAGKYIPNALVLRLLLSVVFGLVILAITNITDYPLETKLIIYVYSFAFVFDALSDVAFSVFRAFERMEYSAVIQLGRDLINVGVSLGAIYLGAGIVVLVLVSALASLAKLLTSFAILRLKFPKPELKVDQVLARQLLKLALPFAAMGLVALVNRQIDTILLSIYRPEQEVGWFAAANTLITYLLLIPAIFMQAVFPTFARFHSLSREALKRAYRTSFKYMLLIGFPLFVGTIVTADKIIALIYGPGFDNAATALRILAFLLLWMFGWVNGALLKASGAQSFLAQISAAGSALNVAVALILIPRLGYIGASIAAIAGGAVFSIPLTLVSHRRLSTRPPYARAFKTLVAALLMGLVVWLALRAQINLMICIFVMAPMTYGSLAVVFGVVGREDRMLLAKLFRKSAVAGHAQ